jgi:hypothetical protein
MKRLNNGNKIIEMDKKKGKKMIIGKKWQWVSDE